MPSNSTVSSMTNLHKTIRERVGERLKQVANSETAEAGTVCKKKYDMVLGNIMVMQRKTKSRIIEFDNCKKSWSILNRSRRKPTWSCRPWWKNSRSKLTRATTNRDQRKTRRISMQLRPIEKERPYSDVYLVLLLDDDIRKWLCQIDWRWEINMYAHSRSKRKERDLSRATKPTIVATSINAFFWLSRFPLPDELDLLRINIF